MRLSLLILIIDDESLVRRSLRRAAEAGGHKVIEAENGVAGLELWSAKDPDIVFLDVLMPGLTGPQVLKEIKSTNKAKVVLISAYTGEYNIEVAKELGADLFIPKPFDDIFDVIKKAEGLI